MRQRPRGRWWAGAIRLLLAGGMTFATGAAAPLARAADAGSAASGVADLLDALKSNRLGSFYLSLRPRYEYAKIQGARHSNALTLRTAAGFGSRSWRGLSFLVEGEAVSAADSDWYFNGVRRSNGRSLVPDPADIDLNQGYLHYEHTEWTTHLRVGRQRLILDDARFIGNVGWRQNEQTYDAALLATGAGRRDLRFTYAYLHQALRIFGDKAPSRRDFDSTSHLLNLRWSAYDWARPAVFAYLLDFDNSARDSSHSYGVRVTGELALAGRWQLDYSVSYAYQRDAANNPDDYDAHYVWAQGALVHQQAGTLAVGFERLGSDDGKAVFRTPLGTIHNFNGWADAFLDNGGPDGLRDLFVRAVPKLPWRLDAELAFHQFWRDEGGERLGWEIDAYVSRPLTRFVTVLAKTAYFERSTSDRGRPDVFRTWLQLTFEF